MRIKVPDLLENFKHGHHFSLLENPGVIVILDGFNVIEVLHDLEDNFFLEEGD